MTQTPTTDQLRARIDSGATGEKVGHSDPAAAPLGTDAEASGNPPTMAERRMEAAAQPRVRPSYPINGPVLYLGIIVALAAAMFTVVKLFA